MASSNNEADQLRRAMPARDRFVCSRWPLAGRSGKPVPKLKVFGQLGEANALARVVYAFLIGGHVAIP